MKKIIITGFICIITVFIIHAQEAVVSKGDQFSRKGNKVKPIHIVRESSTKTN